MDRRVFIGTLAGSLLAAPLAAKAQPAGKVYRIGFLGVASAARFETFLDPVEAGAVASLPRPGGNITGSFFSDEVTAKRLDILKTALPSLTRVGTLANPESCRGRRLERHAFAGEERALQDALSSALRALFTVSVHTGLRWSEQRTLKWRDVDLLAGFVTVPPGAWCTATGTLSPPGWSWLG